MESIEVRQRLVEPLLLDLVGPFPGSPLESETLPQTPSRWYLTGFLVPTRKAPVNQRFARDLPREIDGEKWTPKRIGKRRERA